jgi:hypothetical protein
MSAGCDKKTRHIAVSEFFRTAARAKQKYGEIHRFRGFEELTAITGIGDNDRVRFFFDRRALEKADIIASMVFDVSRYLSELYERRKSVVVFDEEFINAMQDSFPKHLFFSMCGMIFNYNSVSGQTGACF